MNLWLGLQIGLKEIVAHKFRSFLTMLGIILGVASLLSMFALTEGIARGMREVLEARGGIETVNVTTKDVSEKFQNIADTSPGRTMQDVVAIRKGAPLVHLVSPESRLNNAAITRGNKTARRRVIGALPAYFEAGKYEIESGRFLTDLDIDRVHRVVVLGSQVIDELWGADSEIEPVGQQILINQVPFTVVGTLPLFETEEARRKRELGITEAHAEPRSRRGRGNRRRGWDPFFWQNNAVVIPITTMFSEFKSAQQAEGETNQGPDLQLDNLTFRVNDLRRFEDALAQVRNVLTQTHRGIDDFGFDTQEEWFDNIETSVQATRVSGGLIAGISLLVGGIGITNIMLASITERIREIGVRRAVGATQRNIFMQILVESGVIGFIGGLIGLAGAMVMIRLLMMLSPTENTPVVTLQSALISFGFAVVIGILSGLYPAWRAAKLDPIEALRYG